MKKNTITKVLIAMVMVALLCALCACGGGGGGSSGGGGGNGGGTGASTTALNTPKLSIKNGVVSWVSVSKAGSYEYIVTDADGVDGEPQTTTDKSITIQEGESVKVRAIPSDTAKYTASEWSEKTTFVPGINTQIINLVKGIQSYVDILNDVQATDTLSADVAVGGYFTSGDETKTLALAAKANANKTNPSFLIDFKLNDVAYVSLGLKDNKILVREPMNFINTDDEVANAFAIDVDAFDPTIKAVAEILMEALATKEDISFSDITEAVEGILGTFPMDLEPLIALEQNGNVTSLGVKMDLLKTGLTLLPTLLKKSDAEIGEMIDGYIAYANKAMEVAGQENIKLGDRDLSWNTIKAHINNAPGEASLIKIKATYTGKAISALALELDLEALNIEGVDYKAGLNVDITSFTKAKTVAIDTSAFKAKDLVAYTIVSVPQKGLMADVSATIRLSDGFAAAGNKIATATVTVTDLNANTSAEAYGYVTDEGAYVDFTPVFDMFGLEGYDTKFRQELGFSVIDMINASMTEEEPENGALDGMEVAGFDVAAIVEDFSAAEDKVEFVCNFIYNNFIAVYDENVEANENAGQAEVIAWLFNLELGDTQSYVRDYVKFYNQQTTFEALIDSIVAIHEANAATLDAATVTTESSAGIQLLLEGEDNDLLDYVAKFVRIPSISDGEVDFADLKEVNDAAALKDWLNWIFPVDKEARILVEDILGITLDEIIDDGLYLEADNLGGLQGAIYAAADADLEEVYVSITAGIVIDDSVRDTHAAITDAVDFTNTTADEKYSIAVSMLALLDAVRAYGAAE